MILCPAGCGPQNVVGAALPSQGGGDFKRVQHGAGVVDRQKGRARSAVGNPAQDCGFRTRHAVHHRQAGRADTGRRPNLNRNGEGWPVGKGRQWCGRWGGNGGARGGIDHHRIDDAVAARRQRRVKRLLTFAQQEQRGLAKGAHRGFGAGNIVWCPVGGGGGG